MHDTLFTIGHSNHPLERFIDLLQRNRIAAVADVRSTPYSRHNPQYNREPLQESLRNAGILYLYFGAELGARCPDPACFENNRVLFSRVARTGPFIHGLEQVRLAMAKRRLALMCAEKDPLQCHRTILICRSLRTEPFNVSHILADGSLETQADLETRLLTLTKVSENDLFLDREQLIERAYDLLGERMTAAIRSKT
jgi:uncharacterized protein (DUF488 family)